MLSSVVFVLFALFVCMSFFLDHTSWLSSLWGIAQCIGKYSIININCRGWAQLEEHWSVCCRFNFLAKPRAKVLKMTSKIMLAVILTVPGVQIMKNGPKWRAEDKKWKVGRGTKERILSPSLPTPPPSLHPLADCSYSHFHSPSPVSALSHYLWYRQW